MNEVLSDSDRDSFEDETNCDISREGKLFCMYRCIVHVPAISRVRQDYAL